MWVEEHNWGGLVGWVFAQYRVVGGILAEPDSDSFGVRCWVSRPLAHSWLGSFGLFEEFVVSRRSMMGCERLELARDVVDEDSSCCSFYLPTEPEQLGYIDSQLLKYCTL